MICDMCLKASKRNSIVFDCIKMYKIDKAKKGTGI